MDTSIGQGGDIKGAGPVSCHVRIYHLQQEDGLAGQGGRRSEPAGPDLRQIGPAIQ